jgi:hypothetical protein
MTDTGHFLPAGQTSTSNSIDAQVGGGANWLLTREGVREDDGGRREERR